MNHGISRRQLFLRVLGGISALCALPFAKVIGKEPRRTVRRLKYRYGKKPVWTPHAGDYVTITTYDYMSRQTSIQDPCGGILSMVYDPGADRA